MCAGGKGRDWALRAGFRVRGFLGGAGEALLRWPPLCPSVGSSSVCRDEEATLTQGLGKAGSLAQLMGQVNKIIAKQQSFKCHSISVTNFSSNAAMWNIQ